MELEKNQSETAQTESAATPAAATARGAAQALDIPDDALIVVPVRNVVLFPGMVLPVTIGRELSVAAAQAAVKADKPIGLLLQKDPKLDQPGPEDLYGLGTVAQILRYITTPDGANHIVCQGEARFRVVEFLDGYPFLVARVARMARPDEAGKETEARLMQLKERAVQALELLPETPQEMVQAVQGYTSAGQLADMVAGFMDVKPAEKQAVLEITDVEPRVDRVLEMLAHRIEVMKLSREIESKTKATMDERQREYVLREQMRQIQKELGEAEGTAAELADLEKTIEAAGMPEDVLAHAKKELKRLARMPDSSSEYSMARTYVDWLAELPWKAGPPPAIDLAAARQILDEDHYGLDKIKRRILEFLAVRKLAPEGHAPILCFVGPPGVGKTSLGQSIARALGRKFVRVALGGLHDEAEIRGHRRTYIGALPGNIIQAIKKAGSRDCVLMLDEVDKIGQGFHGDPNAALLEVLDPEQNHTFRDNYLGVPFDLSKVVFITTANVLDSVPGPLRDRMEVIHLPGYTEEEKLQIARRYLVKRQLEANGLKADQVQLGDAVLAAIIHDYTREAGVRNLEREIGSVLRHAAVKIAEGVPPPVRIEVPQLAEILGPAKFEAELAQRTSLPGVATGLAWTPVGGDILFIEASRTTGGGKLILTGQLGDVMKESAQAALTLVKSRAGGLGIDAALFDKSDVHVHVPAGAIPKDGPSAGVAMFMALASLLTERPVRHDTAMTGEISLRGLVLPVGGIKEKVLAAMRAGITTVMLPARNRKDLQDVPESARERLKFVWLETVDDAVGAALGTTQAKAA
ncbi:MAG TPA: endopeptidase La [Burkholderiales bacterium]|jgi:ATP-dependent Lon protease|nr:endopeptidase La [Burkholderiales bacterium]